MQRVLLILLYFLSLEAIAGDTELRLYRPYGEVSEQSVPVVLSKIKGQCDSQSRLMVREDAWRCEANGVTYDPCFVKTGGSQIEAICPQSPWSGDSISISVNLPFNNEHHKPLDMSRTFPWAVELTNGEQCKAVDTDEVFDSMPVRYRCNSKNLLVGHLQRCKSVWSMLEKTPEGVITVELNKAWF
ncbi:MAG: hypothetical protein Q8M40_10750 [Legionella sp.]|nr:hypothetical protein [Legionella sp.]